MTFSHLRHCFQTRLQVGTYLRSLLGNWLVIAWATWILLISIMKPCSLSPPTMPFIWDCRPERERETHCLLYHWLSLLVLTSTARNLYVWLRMVIGGQESQGKFKQMALDPYIHSSSFCSHNIYLQNKVARKEKNKLAALGLKLVMNCTCNLKMVYFLAGK